MDKLTLLCIKPVDGQDLIVVDQVYGQSEIGLKCNSGSLIMLTLILVYVTVDFHLIVLVEYFLLVYAFRIIRRDMLRVYVQDMLPSSEWWRNYKI